MKTIVTVIALAFIIGFVSFLFACDDDWCALFDFQKARLADSFERCAALGFPVAESYPRQCHALGKSFTETLAPSAADKIKVSSPLPNALVKSPLTVTGEARGTWYFEASFPVRLLDANGKELAVIPAQATSDWMTTEFVPFKATLIFALPSTAEGTLILEKDNPSGLPENDDSISIPVRFR
ncbi:Gmad2 immunoglobulin-like domain-containing protein [Candidatus Parcubacteria bacterium]|nr:Gmad2 immunoglobulin-like domain-containing protein [Candidatus Parcubacteria bacterium]